MNKDKILSGTQKKRLKNEFSYLMENFNKTNAIKFNLYCKDQPVTLLFECSDMLYREPHRGLNHITEMVKSVPVHPSIILELSNDMNSYLNKNSKNMSVDHRLRFESALEEINTIIDDNPRVMLGDTILDDILDSKEYNKITDLCSIDELTDDIREDIIEEVSLMAKNISAILILTSFIIRRNDDTLMTMYLNHFIKGTSDVDGIEAYLTLSHILPVISRDKFMGIGIDRFNMEVKSIMKSILDKDHLVYSRNLDVKKSYVDIDDAMDNIDMVNATDEAKDNITTQIADKHIESVIAAYDMLTASDEELDDVYAELVSDLIVTGDKKAKSTYKDYLDTRIATLESSIESLETKLVEEWTKDGTPDPVIARHAGELSDRDKNRHLLNGRMNNRDINSSKINNSKINAKEEDDDDDEDSDEERSILSMIDDDDDDLATEAVELKGSDKLRNKLDQIKKDREDKKAIKDMKPKKTLTVRAMEVEKNTKIAVAKSQVAGDKVVGAAKAVVSIPAAITDSVKATINKWDDLDDSKRKEYILKPGFRKTYYRAFKLALTHGILFAVNPLLNIVLFISSKLSAQKNIRITNEIISELNTEIAICEDKMEEASARGELEAKNKVRRIKDKLSAELTRVQANSKYI